MNNKGPARANGQNIKTRSQTAAIVQTGAKLERHTTSDSATAPQQQGMMPHSPETSARTVSHREIAKRAYEKFAGRGHLHGFDREDWAAAEADLLAEAGRKMRD